MNIFVRNDEVEPSDLNLIFDPQPGDEFLVVDGRIKLQDIVTRMGWISSKREAVKNGFGGPLPKGYSEIRVGNKLKAWWNNQWLYIWNPTKTLAETEDA